MRYIVVLHNHFVDSKGFDTIEIEADSYDDAYDKGKVLCYDKDSTFNHCSFTLIEISDHERLVKRNIFGRAFITELPEDNNSES